ncbi:hypothetical protein [Sinorhizobium chiapasense]|uniref:Uncharacterized protein n=1 Tax=Sinorhizobium chiapasense TaxID=501572 RepID=A0ABZ2B8D9_9HYPH
MKAMEDNRLPRAIALLEYVGTHSTTITYGEFADIIGGMIAQGVGHFLTKEVAPYCRANGLPPLWVLIVNARTGQNGYKAEATPADIAACYAYFRPRKAS